MVPGGSLGAQGVHWEARLVSVQGPQEVPGRSLEVLGALGLLGVLLGKSAPVRCGQHTLEASVATGGILMP